ncbi:hypothetical protein FRACA_1950005 [Frankia canadensis]|uniref:Uncharacterized protein n=1 Tax=Frankia canadensis TaxID=1836972 RepID=A0A2I2KPH7_9ACTN|nr:hypothetical protein FRACA_1950005 [Frankia canadensis]SOU54842.1 hypothetical protein FRACA_1950005 [Frankia canadensis]
MHPALVVDPALAVNDAVRVGGEGRRGVMDGLDGLAGVEGGRPVALGGRAAVGRDDRHPRQDDGDGDGDEPQPAVEGHDRQHEAHDPQRHRRQVAKLPALDVGLPGPAGGGDQHRPRLPEPHPYLTRLVPVPHPISSFPPAEENGADAAPVTRALSGTNLCGNVHVPVGWSSAGRLRALPPCSCARSRDHRVVPPARRWGDEHGVPRPGTST